MKLGGGEPTLKWMWIKGNIQAEDTHIYSTIHHNEGLQPAANNMKSTMYEYTLSSSHWLEEILGEGKRGNNEQVHGLRCPRMSKSVGDRTGEQAVGWMSIRLTKASVTIVTILTARLLLAAWLLSEVGALTDCCPAAALYGWRKNDAWGRSSSSSSRACST